MGKVAIVFGCTGIVGRDLTAALTDSTSTYDHVLAVSRRDDATTRKLLGIEADNKKLVIVKADYEDDNTVKTLILPEKPTDVYFVAINPTHPTGSKEEYDANTNLLENALKVLLNTYGGNLKELQANINLVLLTGAKAYCDHFGPDHWADYKVPFEETMGRHPMPPYNFYFGQEDKLNEYGVKWCTLRPSPIIGSTIGRWLSFSAGFAVYAAICKHLKRPLVFPGSIKSMSVRKELSAVELIIPMMIWAAQSGQCTQPGQFFNCSNGDTFQWGDVYAHVAKFFGLEIVYPKGDDPNTTILNLGEFIQTEEAKQAWKELREKHNLENSCQKLEDVTAWPYNQLGPVRFHDAYSSNEKRYQLGFTLKINTFENLDKVFNDMIKRKMVPDPNKI